MGFRIGELQVWQRNRRKPLRCLPNFTDSVLRVVQFMFASMILLYTKQLLFVNADLGRNYKK